jgi:cell division septum initiation protein DivIVA
VVKDLGPRFGEVEKRVRELVEENSRLRGRVNELEHELKQAGNCAAEIESLRSRKTQVQDRLKRLLHLLEKVEAKEGGQQEAERSS